MDRVRPVQQSYAGAALPVVLEEKLTSGLKGLSRRHGTTLYMTLLAGWAILLTRLSGQQDVVIGSPVANRGRTEIENLIGFFVNTLALRLDLSGSPGVSELLRQTKAQALAAAGMPPPSIRAIETFRSRVLSSPAVEADLVPAS